MRTVEKWFSLECCRPFHHEGKLVGWNWPSGFAGVPGITPLHTDNPTLDIWSLYSIFLCSSKRFEADQEPVWRKTNPIIYLLNTISVPKHDMISICSIYIQINLPNIWWRPSRLTLQFLGKQQRTGIRFKIVNYKTSCKYTHTEVFAISWFKTLNTE